MKKNLFILFAFLTLFSCQEDSDTPTPDVTSENKLTGDLKGQSLSVTGSSVQAVYFLDEGDEFGAAEVTAQLPNSERLTFFVDELKDGTITLIQSFPAVMGVNSSGLRSNSESARVQALPPSFVKFLSGTNSFFAISGKLVIKIDGNKLSLDWDITFKDKDGNTFTSKGAFEVQDFKKVTKPKSQISNPTTDLTIASLTPSYGKAGIEVSIKGTGFSALKDENTIKLNDLLVEATSASPTEIKLSIPENGEHGKFSVSVLGESVETEMFYYEPIISSISTELAKVGDEVSIIGKHFDTDKSLLEVKMGEKVLVINSASLTSLKVVVPEGAVTGNVTVARKGKDAVEGPELQIEEKQETLGLPVEEIFEVIDGDISFEEVLSNANEFGAIWNIQIDAEKNVLYAVTATSLLSIDLTTNSVTKLAGTESEIYKNDLNVYNSLTLPLALYPKGNTLFGIKSGVFMIGGVQNGFKLNLSSNSVEMFGDHKITNGADPYGLFVGDNERIYMPEFVSPGPGYVFASYDKNFLNRKVLQEDAGNFVFLLAMSGNKYRYVSKRSIGDIKYFDGDGESVGDFISWKDQLLSISADGASFTRLIGMDYRNSNIYAMAAASLDNANIGVTSYPKLNYTLGKQMNASGNFQKLGEFSIIQTFQFAGNTYYIRSGESAMKTFVVDKSGDAYILLQTPINPSTGEEVSPGSGGIYKVKL